MELKSLSKHADCETTVDVEAASEPSSQVHGWSSQIARSSLRMVQGASLSIHAADLHARLVNKQCSKKFCYIMH